MRTLTTSFVLYLYFITCWLIWVYRCLNAEIYVFLMWVSVHCRYDLHLSFEESIFGGQHEIEVSYFETCDSCGGTGAKSSSCIQSCNACGGKGGVTKTQRTPFGIISQVISHSRKTIIIVYGIVVASEFFYHSARETVCTLWVEFGSWTYFLSAFCLN